MRHKLLSQNPYFSAWNCVCIQKKKKLSSFVNGNGLVVGKSLHCDSFKKKFRLLSVLTAESEEVLFDFRTECFSWGA